MANLINEKEYVSYVNRFTFGIEEDSNDKYLASIEFIPPSSVVIHSIENQKISQKLYSNCLGALWWIWDGFFLFKICRQRLSSKKKPNSNLLISNYHHSNHSYSQESSKKKRYCFSFSDIAIITSDDQKLKIQIYSNDKDINRKILNIVPVKNSCSISYLTYHLLNGGATYLKDFVDHCKKPYIPKSSIKENIVNNNMIPMFSVDIVNDRGLLALNSARSESNNQLNDIESANVTVIRYDKQIETLPEMNSLQCSGTFSPNDGDSIQSTVSNLETEIKNSIHELSPIKEEINGASLDPINSIDYSKQFSDSCNFNIPIHQNSLDSGAPIFKTAGIVGGLGLGAVSIMSQRSMFINEYKQSLDALSMESTDSKISGLSKQASLTFLNNIRSRCDSTYAGSVMDQHNFKSFRKNRSKSSHFSLKTAFSVNGTSLLNRVMCPLTNVSASIVPDEDYKKDVIEEFSPPNTDFNKDYFSTNKKKKIILTPDCD